MTNTQSKTANVLGAKTARACDSCLRKRARWFCAADDAFLCQNCDTSVHSANQLASRHERVRLETASCKIKLDHKTSSWHQGFTKKPRTPRSRRLSAQAQLHHHNKDDATVEERKPRDWNRGFLVPEISSGGGGDEEEDMDAYIIDENDQRDQLLYRVPVLDEINDIIVKDSEFDDLDMFLNDHDASRMNNIPGFTSSDIELEDLALDSLLETEQIKDGSKTCGLEDKRFKLEKENMEYCGYDLGLDTTSESFNWEFDYTMSPIIGEDEEEIRIINTSDLSAAARDIEIEMDGKEKRRINLKINYDGVISAWDCQSSPWIDGIKPQDFSLDDCLDDFMIRRSGIEENRNGVNVGRCWDEEREAKVLRYREKRRKRLFAKKIRYQVRKLNAEKRPRMKGRFVKRTSFV